MVKGNGTQQEEDGANLIKHVDPNGDFGVRFYGECSISDKDSEELCK